MLSNKIKFSDIGNILKIWLSLPNSMRIKTHTVLFLTIIGTFLEAIGIGLVIPAVSMIANIDIEIFNKFSYYREIQSIFSKNQIALGATFLLFILYFFKGIFLSLMYLIQAKYIYSVKAHISDELFKNYIHLPYESLIQKNSSECISNLTTEVQIFTSRVMKPMLTLITEVGVVLATGALFLLVQPVGALLMVISLISIVYFYDLISKGFLLKWGSERQLNEAKKVRVAQEGILGLREIKLTGAEQEFLKIYRQHNHNATNVEAKEEALYHIPRISLEVIGVWGVLIIVWLSTIENKNDSSTILTISLFAASAFRILPSINRIVGSWQSISYCKQLIETLSIELYRSPKVNLQKIKDEKFNKTIEIVNLDYKYPDTDSFIFKSVNFKISRGECIGIIGPSGVGKSTFADLISGLLEPTSGAILIDGTKDINNHLYLQKIVGYVQQRTFLIDDSIKKNIALGVSDEKIDINRINEVVKSANLVDYINTIPDGINARVGELGGNISGGQRQRIGIARALYRNPQILIFDEGTSALDQISEREIIKTLISIKSNTALIIISHRPASLQICDRIYRIESENIISN